MSELDGVDVASFQGGPATWQAAAGPIGWAAVKLTELTSEGYIDPDADADWAWLGHAGHARIGYLFGHPNVSPASTVAYFIAETARLGLADGDAVALDLEVTDGKSPTEVSAWAAEVLGALHANLHRVPLNYTYVDFALEGNCAGLGGYPLWISDPNHPAGRPAVPGPWKTWAIHQYGVTGAIDRDVIAWPTVADMRAALGKTTTNPAATAARKDPKMLLVEVNRTEVPHGTAWPGVFLLAADGTLHHVATDADVAAYQKTGIPGPVVISWAEYAARSGEPAPTA
jgi:hypothetical protein